MEQTELQKAADECRRLREALDGASLNRRAAEVDLIACQDAERIAERNLNMQLDRMESIIKNAR